MSEISNGPARGQRQSIEGRRVAVPTDQRDVTKEAGRSTCPRATPGHSDRRSLDECIAIVDTFPRDRAAARLVEAAVIPRLESLTACYEVALPNLEVDAVFIDFYNEAARLRRKVARGRARIAATKLGLRRPGHRFPAGTSKAADGRSPKPETPPSPTPRRRSAAQQHGPPGGSFSSPTCSFDTEGAAGVSDGGAMT